MIEDVKVEGYQLVGEIGRGGFGVVHRARQVGLDRDVALKVLAAGQMNDDAVRRFERECRVLGRLSDHPNIVTVHGSGFTSAGDPFIAMEFVARGSLADRLAQTGTLTWQEAASHIVKLAGALETAHRAGVLHRDVKPENVLLSGYGEPMLADFGIARVDDGTRTQAGAITASLAHAAPEVLDGRDPTPAADIYALASTFFHLVAGRLAFDPGDGGIVAMIGKVLNRPVPDLRGEGIPDAICRAIEVGMAKTPEERPATAEGYATLVMDAAAASGEPLPAPRIGSQAPNTHEADVPGAVAGAGSEASSTTPGADATRIHARASGEGPLGGLPELVATTEPSSRPAWLVPVGGVVLLLLLVTAASSLLRDNRDDGVAPDDTASQLVDDARPGSSNDNSGSEASSNSGSVGSAAESGAERILWTHEAPAGADDVLLLQVFNAAVTVMREGQVQALDPESGVRRWSADVNALVDAPVPVVGFDDEQVLILRDSGNAVAVEAFTGVELWKQSLPLAVASSHGMLIGSNVSDVVAHDPRSGALRWRHELAVGTGPAKVAPSPDSTHIAMRTGFEVFGLDASTGRPSPLVEFRRLVTDLVVAGKQAFMVAVAGDSSTVVASDLETGEAFDLLVINEEFKNAKLAATTDTVVVFDGGRLLALGAIDGQINWEVPVEDASAFVELTPNGLVLVENIGTSARLRLIGLYDTGAVTCAQDVALHTITPTVGQDRVYIVSTDGRLLAYEIETCKLAWSHQLPDGLAGAAAFVVDQSGFGFQLDSSGGVTAFRLWDN